MELCVPIYLSSQKVKVLVLIDSSAGGVFIDSSFICQMWFKVNDLLTKIVVYNMDRTSNRNGSITQEVEASLEIQGRQMKERFLVTALGKQQVILVYLWLEKANPKINWKKKEFSWWDDEEKQVNIYVMIRKILERGVYEETSDLVVISFLGWEQHELTDKWISD